MSPLFSAEQSRAGANLDGEKSYFVRLSPLEEIREVTLKPTFIVVIVSRFMGRKGPSRPIV